VFRIRIGFNADPDSAFYLNADPDADLVLGSCIPVFAEEIIF
jgi:hypothetical protein